MLSTSTTHKQVRFGQNRLLQGLTLWYVMVWVVTAIRPLDRHDWVLENLLVAAAMVLLVGTYRRFPLSDLSYLLIALFMTLHAIGAHWTYAEVPFGYWLRDTLGLVRNPFDRLVHFSFGLLLAYPIREVVLRVANARGFWAYYLPFDVTLAFSAAYEIMEMVVATMVAPGTGDAWLGTQGDVWDAQKDMASAALGAVLCMVVTAVVRRLRAPRPILLAGSAGERPTASGG
jgi:putative membrane protein